MKSEIMAKLNFYHPFVCGIVEEVCKAMWKQTLNIVSTN